MKVIVTGATKGIGRAISEAFLAEGADIAVCARTQADLEQMKAALQAAYPNAEILTQQVDVGNKAEVLAFGQFIQSKWDRVDVLVNNAGVFIPGKISEEEAGALEQMMNVNLYSAYYLSRSIIPMMKTQKSGHIFNICSIASLMAYPHGSSYSITKFAMLGLSKVLRDELKEDGIRVTSILPGATWSNSWEGSGFPKERLMKAEDVAKTVVGAYNLSHQAVVEEIVLRPQLGDL